LNLFGRTQDVSALGLEQSSLGKLFSQAAAAEELRVTTNQAALVQGEFFRSDHFSLVRAGVPGVFFQSGLEFVGRPAEWGEQQWDEFVAKRYHRSEERR